MREGQGSLCGGDPARLASPEHSPDQTLGAITQVENPREPSGHYTPTYQGCIKGLGCIC